MAFEWMLFFEFLESEGYLYFLEIPSEGEDQTFFSLPDRSRIKSKYDLNEEERKAGGWVGLEDYHLYEKNGSSTKFTPLGEEKSFRVLTKEVSALREFIGKTMFPTHKLREFVDNKFKTEEQMRFETEMTETRGMFNINMRWTKAMVIVTAVSIVVALGIGVYNILKDSDSKTYPQQHEELVNVTPSTSIDTTQIEVIKLTPL